MMCPILSTYMVLFLIFAISFSSTDIHDSLVQNEIVPINSEPIPLKMYGFLIYPSNANFKNCILPFISSSENLLKIFFHFQTLNSNVELEKFLPYSALKVTVHDLQESHVAYIVQNQFNPILICRTTSETIYKTVKCGYIDEIIDENSIFALFSSNKIYSLKSYILPKNQKVFATYDESDGMFFVALKKTQEKLMVVSHGTIESNDIEFFYFVLNLIVDAHNLNSLSKIYFQLIDFWDKYKNFLQRLFQKLENKFFHDWDLLAVFPLLIAFFFYYHTLMLPFHILSIPLDFFLSEHNFRLSVGGYPTYFNYFWLFPCLFHFIFRICFVHFDTDLRFLRMLVSKDHREYENFRLHDIKLQKPMYAVPYLLERRKYFTNIRFFCQYIGTVLIEFIFLIVFGLVASLPFISLFIIHGESNE